MSWKKNVKLQNDIFMFRGFNIFNVCTYVKHLKKTTSHVSLHLSTKMGTLVCNTVGNEMNKVETQISYIMYEYLMSLCQQRFDSLLEN